MQTKTVTLSLDALAELLAKTESLDAAFLELHLWRLLDKYSVTVIKMIGSDDEPRFYAWCSGINEIPGHYFDVYPQDAEASSDSYLEAGIRAVALRLLGETLDINQPQS